MNRKVLLAIIINFIILLSIYTLIGLVTKHSDQTDDTSRIRFYFFIGVHVMVFISIIVMVRLDDIYGYCLMGFLNCLITTVALYLCEQRVRSIQKHPTYNFRKFTATTQKLQLTFLNIYFLVYMYAIIGLITTALFLLATQMFICWQEHLINSNIDKCLTKFTYREELKGAECAICLQDLEENGQVFTEINICKHVFHQRCLIEWIKHNKTCPLDRKNIFDFEDQENRGEVYQ